MLNHVTSPFRFEKSVTSPTMHQKILVQYTWNPILHIYICIYIYINNIIYIYIYICDFPLFPIWLGEIARTPQPCFVRSPWCFGSWKRPRPPSRRWTTRRYISGRWSPRATGAVAPSQLGLMWMVEGCGFTWEKPRKTIKMVVEWDLMGFSWGFSLW